MNYDRRIDNAKTILTAMPYVDPAPGTPCQHCDIDVGFICPQCALVAAAGDLARLTLFQPHPVIAEIQAALDGDQHMLFRNIRAAIAKYQPKQPPEKQS